MKALAYLTPAFIRSHHTCENHRGVSMVYAKDPAIFQAQVPPLDVAQLMKAPAQALCRLNRRRDHADRHWSCRRRGDDLPVGGPRHPQPAIGAPASPWGRPELF